jgi:hypothetical protein
MSRTRSITAVTRSARKKGATKKGFNSEDFRYMSEEKMTTEQHRERHKMLHEHFDELLADFLFHNRDKLKLPSNTSVMELVEWSHRQTIEPEG